MPQYPDSNGINMCPHCRCKAGKDNKPVKYLIIRKDIETKKETIIDEVCDSCEDNVGYHERSYDD
jgi:hypothetical protein